MKVYIKKPKIEPLQEKAIFSQKINLKNEEFKTKEGQLLRLIHELEIHQIELELQNEELIFAKANVHKTANKYMELYDFAPTGYFTLNKNGEIIELNLSGANILGKERLNLRYNHFDFFVFDDTKLIFDQFLQKVFGKKRKANCEVRLKTNQNEEKYVNISGIAIDNGEKCLINVIDVTENRLAQKLIIEQIHEQAKQNEENEKRANELAKINKELTSQIHDKELLETKLIQAKEKAEENERFKTAFLANMSHEIRTPLNGILGFTALLKTPNQHIEKQQKYISMIEQGGEHLLEIINDLIDLSRIQSGMTRVALSPCNVNEQIEYIFSFFKPEIEKKGMWIIYHADLPEKKAIVMTDREKVDAILTNLVKNAIKYSSQGTIEIGYQLNKERIYDSIDRPVELTFFVKDMGIGIPPDKLNAIFERFVQVESKNVKSIHGVGLGLAIAKSYAEILEGKLWVESELGKGSTFYFSIPYNNVTEEQQEVKNTSSDNDLNIKKLKILIADDDESSIMLANVLVDKFSKKILLAKNGIEAVEVCQNHKDIDLILMDIKMPVLPGNEAVRQIRYFNNSVYIIAQTAYAYEEDREKAIEAGCDDYITKPLNQDMLNRLINNRFKE